MTQKLFEYLSVYDKILVTGPQRSGTRVAAKMIAHDTGHTFVDEREFRSRDEERFGRLVGKSHKAVIQCPGMCYCIHEHADDDTLVVLMIRDMEDVAASEERVSWKGGPYYELEKYGITGNDAHRFRHSGGRMGHIKYGVWMTAQRMHIPHYLELEYESLAKHPLWIPKSQRKNFKSDQTEL